MVTFSNGLGLIHIVAVNIYSKASQKLHAFCYLLFRCVICQVRRNILYRYTKLGVHIFLLNQYTIIFCYHYLRCALTLSPTTA